MNKLSEVLKYGLVDCFTAWALAAAKQKVLSPLVLVLNLGTCNELRLRDLSERLGL